MSSPTDNPKVIRAQLERVTERMVTELVLDITADLILETPVDLGWAKANWVPSIGRPVTGTDGSRDSVSTGAQERGIAQIVAYSLDMGVVWISNNVPYIGLLNAGHSPKAPAGFVDSAVERNVRRLQGRVFK